MSGQPITNHFGYINKIKIINIKQTEEYKYELSNYFVRNFFL